MGLYIKPDYFQTIHYYFFSLGIFSLTTSFLFTSYNAYSYIFMAFYVVNSGVSWYMSWFMHTRMKAVFVIRTGSYAASHVILTLFSGGMAVGIYWLFEIQFEAIITAFIMINFFVLFMGLMWYILGTLKVTERFLDWQDKNKLEIGKDLVMKLRERKGVKLMDDDALRAYKFGTDPQIDRLFMEAKMKSENGEDFLETARQIEMRMGELKIGELQGKVENISKGELSTAEKELLSSYRSLIKSHEKGMLEYEKALYKKGKEASEKKA